jgi:glycosyltransferase involved in cell wall biosynthesis
LSGPIAIFTRDLAAGGVARVIVNLANGFARLTLPVDVVLARARGPHLAELDPKVRVVDLGAGRTITSLPNLMRYLRNRKPVALLACEETSNVTALLANRLTGSLARVVISIHNQVSVRARHAPSMRMRTVPYLARAFYWWADAVVAVSQGVADDLAAITGLRRDRIEVIYNPIALSTIRDMAQLPLEASGFDPSWFDPGQAPVIVSAGRLDTQKDYPTLIRAFDTLRRRRHVRLLILGEGPERAALTALIGELGREDDVALPGFVANPYPHIARAAVFALSSAWEGFGYVLVEALALGIPVVATDCPSGPAEILAGGRYGQLVPVGDVGSLARAIEAALDRPGADAESLERASAFTTERIVPQYLHMLGLHEEAIRCPKSA